MKALKIFLALCILCMFANSCKKTTTSGYSNYSVKMTDAPGNYSAVNIDLQSVVVTDGNGADVTLNTSARIYNLLNFANGVDTLIATGNLQVGSVEQVRLVLGPNNSVVLNGVTYPLSTPSAQQSGLKLQVHQGLVGGVSYILLLDFDANQSIVQTGNGSFQLKPVIRTIETAISGSIKGSVSPIGAGITITASANGNSYSTVTMANGQFLLQGLPSGVYTITITPPAPASPIVVSNITVNIGAATDMGVINI
jgi:Domain of unknown function (DUF4382)/Carboxypeptidase regulatory-like domain